MASTLCNAWADRGDRVILVPTYSGGGKPFYEVSKNVELVYLANLVGSIGKTPLLYIKRLIALRSLIKLEKPDVVISFLPNVNVAAIISTLFLPVPVICCERRNPLSQKTTIFWELGCKLIYQFSDMLVVQTLAVERCIRNIYPNLKRVRTVPNPLPAKVCLNKKVQANNARKTLLSLGRLSSEKQVLTIVKIFASVAPEFLDWDLHIYGDGPMYGEVEDEINVLGMQHRVFLMGRSADPWSVMAGSDLFIMASRCEGFPNVLLEAMAIGLPCITYDCPSGPREISMDGEFALLVPLNEERELVNALKDLIGSADLRYSLGARARLSILERYALDKILERWDAFFMELGIKF